MIRWRSMEFVNFILLFHIFCACCISVVFSYFCSAVREKKKQYIVHKYLWILYRKCYQLLCTVLYNYIHLYTVWIFFQYFSFEIKKIKAMLLPTTTTTYNFPMLNNRTFIKILEWTDTPSNWEKERERVKDEF